jgi:transcriptional regulator with XRE-family HTH domain
MYLQIMKKAYPNNLRLERERLGWSQEKLANHINISRSQISHWETGEQNPPLETVLRLARYFNVTVEYLFPIITVNDNDNNQQVIIDISDLNAGNREVVLGLVGLLKKQQQKDEK